MRWVKEPPSQPDQYPPSVEDCLAHRCLAHREIMSRPEDECPICEMATLRGEVARLKDTNTRLNRRCQSAEAGLTAKLTSGVSFGRILANSAATMYREERDAARERIAALEDWIREQHEADHEPAYVAEGCDVCLFLSRLPPPQSGPSA